MATGLAQSCTSLEPWRLKRILACPMWSNAALTSAREVRGFPKTSDEKPQTRNQRGFVLEVCKIFFGKIFGPCHSERSEESPYFVLH